MEMSGFCGRSFAVSFLAAMTALTAAAAPIFTDHGLILDGSNAGPWSGGVGAPSVAWDGAQYVMFFEAPGPTAEGCAQSYYIGRATSPDGTAWTVDADPALSPDAADSLRACAVSQPAVVYDSGTWQLFVSMGGALDGSGINTPNGIGWFTSADGQTFTAQGQVIAPTEDIRPSMASAAQLDDQLYVLWSSYPDVYLSVRQADGSWISAESPVISPQSGTSWSDIWVFSPALLCGGDPVGFTAFYGADGSDGRSIALATSADGTIWANDPQTPLSSAGLAMSELNHIDLLSAGDEYIMWYSRTDPGTGLKAIGFASSAETWTEPDDRVGSTEDTGDTGDTGPTDSAPDSATDDSSLSGDSADDISGKDEPKNCGCDGTGGLATAGLLGAAMLLLRRRGR